MADGSARALLDAPLGLRLLERISHRSIEALTDEDLNELLLHLDFRHDGDYQMRLDRLKSRARRLAPLSEWLPRRMPQWWADLDRADQVFAAKTPDAVTESRVAVDLTTMHSEAPKPRRAFWTSTRVTPYISPWLEWPEDQFQQVHLWQVTVSDSARVFEIHSREDWSRLARTYPSATAGRVFSGRLVIPPSDQRLDPDWFRVAADWDGVHLSVGGWLTAEDVACVSDGVTTELRAWNMESTVWLRWCFESVEPAESTG